MINLKQIADKFVIYLLDDTNRVQCIHGLHQLYSPELDIAFNVSYKTENRDLTQLNWSDDDGETSSWCQYCKTTPSSEVIKFDHLCEWCFENIKEIQQKSAFDISLTDNHNVQHDINVFEILYDRIYYTFDGKNYEAYISKYSILTSDFSEEMINKTRDAYSRKLMYIGDLLPLLHYDIIYVITQYLIQVNYTSYYLV